eukprot:6200110-Pleurochrysis_carterae.AAC.1
MVLYGCVSGVLIKYACKPVTYSNPPRFPRSPAPAMAVLQTAATAVLCREQQRRRSANSNGGDALQTATMVALCRWRRQRCFADSGDSSAAQTEGIQGQGDTATGYREFQSGVQGHPIVTTHAFTWRVSTHLFFMGSTWSDRPGIGERAQAQGLGAPTGWLWAGGNQARSGMGAVGTPELRERSASAPQVHMRCECNLKDSACECQTATKSESLRN